MKNFVHLWEMLQTNVVEKIRTHILCSINFLQKFCHLWDNVEIYGRARKAKDDNIMWHICCPCRVPKARIQTCRIYNSCCFSIPTMVMWMCVCVMLYICCLSCCWMSSYTFYDLQERHMNCIHLQAANQVL
jgi:hypothetical protein